MREGEWGKEGVSEEVCVGPTDGDSERIACAREMRVRVCACLWNMGTAVCVCGGGGGEVRGLRRQQSRLVTSWIDLRYKERERSIYGIKRERDLRYPKTD